MLNAANDNTNVIKFLPRDTLIAGKFIISYERLNLAFTEDRLTAREMAIIFKKWPAFHKWFIHKHRQVFA